MGKRITTKFKPKNKWVREMVEADPLIGSSLDVTKEMLKLRTPKQSLCSVCKGGKMLCGKTSCPIMARLGAFGKLFQNIKDTEIDGSSPPSVFVGRFGYPYVQIGPLTPTFYGNTEILDAPEQWFGKSIDEIIQYRSQLVRGMTPVNVRKPWKAGRLLERTRELSLAEHYVETEMKLTRRPSKRFYMNDDVQPIGPTAPMESVDIGYIRWNRHMETCHYDTDLRAAPATVKLFNEGLPISNIMRAFSMGSFGVEKNRRLVPTRWSITAVDDLLGKHLTQKIKNHPLVNRCEVYESNYIGNRFEVLLVPDAWAYEAYEAWYPNTLWNPDTEHVTIVTDWEPYDGRSTYASMGGCYYSGKLAVLEHLEKVRRQAKVFIFREAYPDYILPVGVWQVRENVRNAMRQEPQRFDTFREALDRVMSRLSIPLEKWYESGPLLRHTLTQRKLTDFFH
ncbi:MAG: Nre family DNA repair protein [Candidatus Bathyarchaeota archaeon]